MALRQQQMLLREGILLGDAARTTNRYETGAMPRRRGTQLIAMR
ncbi:hypothetical protein [Paraburkholderia antibiotica]|nr:hypothetical protein [Paraburkholderia antibiotica]